MQEGKSVSVHLQNAILEKVDRDGDRPVIGLRTESGTFARIPLESVEDAQTATAAYGEEFDVEIRLTPSRNTTRSGRGGNGYGSFSRSGTEQNRETNRENR